MNIVSVRKLFTLFSGEDVLDEYCPVIELALTEVSEMLLPDADENDVRLDFLCAAIANNRLQCIKNARDRSDITYAGKLVSPDQSISLAYSEKLVRDYMELCGGLINNKTFIFSAFASGEDSVS